MLAQSNLSKTFNQNKLRFLTPQALQPQLPLFIYLPGMDGTGRLLDHQADTLRHYFDLRCLKIPRDNLSNWDTLVNQVIVLVEKELKIQPQRQIYLCGESFGGCLALKVITTAPWLCSHLILVNPASSFQSVPWLSLGVPLTQIIPEFIHQRATLGLLPVLAALNRITPKNRRALLDAMQSLASDVVSWRLSLLRDFELDLTKLSKFKKPVLLIASDADLLLPSVQEAERLQNIFSQAKTITLTNSGHACLLEENVKLTHYLKKVNWV